MSGGMRSLLDDWEKESKTDAVMLHVLDDMKDRYEFGLRKYGKPVKPFDGENYLQHLYEELLDACVYIKATIEEKEKSR